MKSVFVIWKDSEGGMWHPVAKLTRSEDGYRFSYTKGANHKNFIAFPRMEDTQKVYHSMSLFSFFSNRLIPNNRPEFNKMLEWLDMKPSEYDELDLLGISGGARKTDEFRVISAPARTENGLYKIRFFVSGISHLSDVNTDRVDELLDGEKLQFIFEDTNPFDNMAVLVSTKERISIGYCPKYFNQDIRALIDKTETAPYALSVKKLNKSAPAQFKVLCEFSTKWPQGFKALSSEEYQSQVD